MEAFRREYLCEFPDAGAGVFDRELVERILNDDVAPFEIE